jgi:hypothetical protein
MPSDFATFKIPTPFASCFRTFRSVALSIFGRPSFTPWATARLRPAFIDTLERRRPRTGRGQVVGVNNADVSRELRARFNPPRAGLPQTSPWLTPRGRSRQRGRAPFHCCARAASGHAAAPPSSVRKSRRFTDRFPVLPTERIAQLNTAGDRCTAGFRSSLCRVRVKLGHYSHVRCTTALTPKAEVHPQSCYVAQVPDSDVEPTIRSSLRALRAYEAGRKLA